MALVVVACGLALAASAAEASSSGSWADRDIRLVTAHGLMGSDSATFRPRDTLTAGELSDLVAGLSGNPPRATPDPNASVTITQLDAGLVRGMALGSAAREFATAARAAGLAPPNRFGTEVVARLLGLRTDHANDSLEPGPTDPASRAEAAFSAAKILRWKGWEAQYARDLAAAFDLPTVSGWQRRVLRQAVALIGYPYVWGGTSESTQAPFGTEVPGGFDCSGLLWRVFKLAGYAADTSLSNTLRGRTAAALSAEVARSSRIGLSSLAPADIIFFGPRGQQSKPAEIDHAGIYLGGGWMIHATGTGVSLAPLEGTWRARYAWARNPLTEAGL